MRLRIRLLLLLLGGLAVVGALVAGGVILAARQEPAFYRKALAIEPATLAKASNRMIQQSTALASAVRRTGHWEALFTTDQINGWLAVDMMRNHPRALPAGLHDPRVAIDRKQITVACRLERGGTNTVLSLTIEPYVPEPNVVALRIVTARAGLLPVPLGPVLKGLSQAAQDMQLRLDWRQANGDPVAMLSFASGDHPVRIESLRLGDGELYVAGTTKDR